MKNLCSRIVKNFDHMLCRDHRGQGKGRRSSVGILVTYPTASYGPAFSMVLDLRSYSTIFVSRTRVASVKISFSSTLLVENSETTAPFSSLEPVQSI